MLTEFKADLHIHTLLSGCAEIEMLPSLIIAAAQLNELDLIAICDHNSCENAAAVIRVSESSSVKVLPGMEVQTLEGVHVLCIFDNMELAVCMQKIVYDALPKIGLSDERAGEQIIVDEADEFVGLCDRPISMPTSLELERVYAEASELGGVIIPSHVDKHGTGLLDVLGYLSEESGFDAYELSANIEPGAAIELYPDLRGKTLIRSSDAHWLSAIGERQTILRMQHRTLDEVRLALRGQGDREAYIA